MANYQKMLMLPLKDEPEWSMKRLLDILAGRAIAPLKGNGWGGGTVMHLRIYPV
jgi:muramoyltetrapeptide carboxypeptidase